MSKGIDFVKERRAQGRSFSRAVRGLVALIEPVANQNGIDLQVRLSDASARKSEEELLLARYRGPNENFVLVRSGSSGKL